LDIECCFGEMVWVDTQDEQRSRHFIDSAGLDKPCEPPPPPSAEEIKELLGGTGATWEKEQS